MQQPTLPCTVYKAAHTQNQQPTVFAQWDTHVPEPGEGCVPTG